jgi:hypothetical protein
MLLWALAALGQSPEQQMLSTLLGGISMSSYKLQAATPQVSGTNWFDASGWGCTLEQKNGSLGI